MRESLKLTQADLGVRLGVSQGRISQVEASDTTIDPAWALALDAIRLREPWRSDPLDYLIEVALLAITAGGLMGAALALVERMPGLHALNTDDHAFYDAAATPRARYVAGQILELHVEREHGMNEAHTRALIRLASEQTDPGFWIATERVHLLGRSVSDYLTGRRTLAAELPEIATIAPIDVEIPSVPGDDELDALLGPDRRHAWAITAREYGRYRGTDHVHDAQIMVSSDAHARAILTASSFEDLASYRAGD